MLTATLQKSLSHFLSFEFTALDHTCVPSTLPLLALFETWGSSLWQKLMWQCVCSCRGVTAAQGTCLNNGATCKIAHHLRTARNDAEIPLPRWHTAGTLVGRNPPACCYQKGLNRTIVVAELFGDSSIMRPKQKRWRERFQSTPLCINTIVRARKKKKKKKKGLLLFSSWLLSFPTSGEMALSQSMLECTKESFHQVCTHYKWSI